jgi:acyl-coenzyme A synthetase/AMP-(fatty) acid ligase
VLDDDLERVPPGVTGNLYIRGIGLSPGYWQDPVRTDEAFLVDRVRWGRIYRTGDLARVDDRGLVYFLGRADSQIKSRGYRIELGEIESALASTGLAVESVVTAVTTHGFEGQQICCGYVPAADAVADPAAVRQTLRGLLPPYMVPTRWKTWTRLPRGPSGKLDRKGVRDAFAAELAAEEASAAAAPVRVGARASAGAREGASGGFPG